MRASGTFALLTSAPGRVQVTPSSFHADVSRVLRERGVAHQREARTSDGLFSVDLALPGAARWLSGSEGFLGVRVILDPCSPPSRCPVRHGGFQVQRIS